MIKILKASAGTGKTYRLSLEYLAAIMDGKRFEEIVVMTFTRKATAEIRERIFEHLEDILSKGRDSTVYKTLLGVYPDLKLELNRLNDDYNMMLKNKDKVNIYTIDSFINKIFKQAIAPYLGIYTYKIIDDNNNEEVIEEVFRQLLENQADFNLMEKFLKDNTERYINHYLDLIKEVLDNRWKFLLIDYKKRKRKDTTGLTNYLDQCQNILESIAIENGKEFSNGFYVKDYQNLMPEYCKLDIIEEKEAKIIKNYQLFFKKSFWNGSKLRSQKIADLKENLELKYQEFLGVLGSYIYNEEMIPYEEEIFKFSKRIFEIYDSIKFKEKVFTHTDISNYTYKYFYEKELGLLDGKIPTQYFFELLGSNVKSLFIDEFQDTSILQWKILKPLIDKCENVVTVGDEKQSIYGWRGGEKELFGSLDNILEGDIESLSTCYRSEKGIIDFINSFFLNLDIDWAYSNVDHLAEKSQGYVEVLIGGESCKTNTETKSFAKMSTEKQQDIIELNKKIKVDLKKEIAERIKSLPVYNNIAVLARSNKDLTEIAAELDKEGIPYLLESKESLIDYEAVKPLYFLLNYLNYYDFFNLIKFFRSDLIAVNNSALRYLLENKELVERFMQGEEVELKYRDIQKLLREINGLRKLEYGELTNYLIENSGILEKYRENNAALKNINYFFQLMRDFTSLSELMFYIEENNGSEELKQLAVKEDSTVQLMTIHKAKGLSFETEFFYWNPSSGRGGGSNNMKLYIDFDERYQEVEAYLLTNSKYERLFKHLGIGFSERNKIKEITEEINNVYVALTRPEKNLFLYIEGPRRLSLDKDGKCWKGSSYDYYENAILDAAGIDTLCGIVERSKSGQLSISDGKDIIKEPLIPDLREFFEFNTLSEDILSEVNNKKDFNMTLTKEIKRIEGLAIHYYLEHIKYNLKEERKYASNMVFSRYGNILGPIKLRNLIRRINDFIARNTGFFAEGWQVFNEYELEYEGKIYRIDQLRVNEESKEIMILDYKSGVTKEQSQLDKYKEILDKKTRGKYIIKTKFLEI